jgi:hypothetical protein
MGAWTWLERYDAEAFVREVGPGVAPARSVLDAKLDGRLAPVAEMHTHRAWHTLHVALTGDELHGEPPAAWVVGWARGWSGPLAGSDVRWVHEPATVREIAAYLAPLDARRLVREVLARAERGEVALYSEWCFDEEQLVEHLDELRGFYAAAAEAADLVYVHRG